MLNKLKKILITFVVAGVVVGTASRFPDTLDGIVTGARMAQAVPQRRKLFARPEAKVQQRATAEDEKAATRKGLLSRKGQRRGLFSFFKGRANSQQRLLSRQEAPSPPEVSTEEVKKAPRILSRAI